MALLFIRRKWKDPEPATAGGVSPRAGTGLGLRAAAVRVCAACEPVVVGEGRAASDEGLFGIQFVAAAAERSFDVLSALGFLGGFSFSYEKAAHCHVLLLRRSNIPFP